MSKDEIIEFCSGCNGAYHLRESYFKKNFEKEYEEMCLIEFPEYFSFSQKLYHWLHNDFDLKLGICQMCGNRCRFLSFGRGYETYCSKQCIYTNERSEKCKSTKKERYGISSYNNMDKNKKTCLERYGVENVSQVEEIKQRKISKTLNRSENEKQTYKEKIKNTWNNKSKEEIEKHVSKIKNTKIEKYGNCYSNPDKAKQTKYERYGNENYVNFDQAKQTKIERYGNENFVNTEKAKQTKYERYGDPNYTNIEKAKQTKIEKYGDPNYNNREKFKQTTHSKEYSIKKKKQYNRTTLEYELREIKSNGGVSKIEIEFYDWLCNHFNNDDILVQYSSDLYPYHCDFYIKSIDLYIELNGHWTHGGYPFVGDEKDLKRIEYWKSKNSEYYETAIRVWSIADVEKQKIAKENNLNYLVLYSNNLYECIKTFNKFIHDK